tara:strand:- start:116 stop:508 length:393 start_codon:yes stop_codon:yes gene_type:complete
MATFSGPEVLVENLTAEQLFNKLSNLTNLKEIIPSSIESFEASEDSCSFKMKGMPKLDLFISEKNPFSKISLSANGSPVSFSLDCFIRDCGEKCQARLEIYAELNMMMKMMVEKPINNFLNVLSEKLRTI